MNRPPLAAFICLACGILLASFIEISIPLTLLIAAIAVIFSIIIHRRSRKIFTISILISIIFLGAAHIHNSTFIPSNHIAIQIDKTVAKRDVSEIYIKGSIVSDPLYYSTFWGQRRANFVLEVEHYKQKNTWLKSQGLCKVVIYKSQESYDYGQNLILFGNLKLPSKPPNPGEFDYSQYLKRQKIYTILEVESDANIVLSRRETQLSLLGHLKARIFALRKQINRLIRLYLPKQEADLLSAMMLGLRSEIPSESKDLFIQTGTAHILAISSLHLAVIAYILFFILGLLRLPYNMRAFLVIVIICCY
ncbi:MAG: ComEC/Rec2 family competence protein, partial [Candidatus Omnitrophota bacterium]